MPLLTAVTGIAAALLGLAGLRKLVTPAATEAALAGAKLPSSTALVRLLGAGEVVLAAAVFAIGGPLPAALLAVAYGTFAVFAEHQRRLGAGCGCLGETSTPATRLHVGADAIAALGAAAAAIAAAPTVVQSAETPLQAGLLAVALATAAALVSLLLTALPDLAAAVALHEEEAR